MSTTSGRLTRAMWTTSAPLPAVPTTWMSAGREDALHRGTYQEVVVDDKHAHGAIDVNRGHSVTISAPDDTPGRRVAEVKPRAIPRPR